MKLQYKERLTRVPILLAFDKHAVLMDNVEGCPKNQFKVSVQSSLNDVLLATHV